LSRSLVVEGEVAAFVSDPDETLLERAKGGRRGFLARRAGPLAGPAVGGPQGFEPRTLLDVREDELLMLLFVVQAELTDRPRAFVILDALETFAPRPRRRGADTRAPR